MSHLNFVRGLLCTLLISAATNAVTIDMVTVDNPGNASTGPPGFGSVDHAYQIGKYEVTAGQYTEFLNAVAKADPYGLYNEAMGDPIGALGANIQRTNSSPNYSYSVAADWAVRPVNWVSFWDAARFANWLHNGQPIGAQGPGTTEGGAYHDVGNNTLFGRNSGARFFIPTEDEWFKSAYHDKTAGLAPNYFVFPMATGFNPPGRDITETTDPGNNANYFSVFWNSSAIGSPYYRTVAGEFELSHSSYGTFDQGGNVAEWAETLFDGGRLFYGGSFKHDWDRMRMFRSIADPAYEFDFLGFRVARAVPEPSTLLLLCFGVLAVLWRRR